MDRLKTLCVGANIALMLFAAMVCVIGAVMGAGWTKAFFGAIPGQSLLISIILLIAAMMVEFWNGTKVYLTVRMWFKWRKGDILIAVLLLALLVFVFYSRVWAVKSHNLKSIYFVPHIFTCLLSYVFLGKAACLSGKCLIDKSSEIEKDSLRLVGLGFPLLTAGIIIGSVWAKSAWESWWSWDPKETFSLAVWFVFAAYLIFRNFCGQRFLRLNCFWVIIGFLMILVGVTVVNFSKIFAGLHSYTG
jgi:ABC-type transport system involved in cytochrome c biogenesis permease subunit